MFFFQAMKSLIMKTRGVRFGLMCLQDKTVDKIFLIKTQKIQPDESGKRKLSGKTRRPELYWVYKALMKVL